MWVTHQIHLTFWQKKKKNTQTTLSKDEIATMTKTSYESYKIVTVFTELLIYTDSKFVTFESADCATEAFESDFALTNMYNYYRSSQWPYFGPYDPDCVDSTRENDRETGTVRHSKKKFVFFARDRPRSFEQYEN